MTPLTFTDAAAAELRSILADIEGENNFVRVYIAGGGCSGLQYGMAVDESTDELDQRFEIEGIPVVIDAVSLKYVQGSVVDHSGGMMGAFRFDNPKATRACGCSMSFSVDDAEAMGIDGSRYGGCASCPSLKGGSQND